MSPNRRLLVSAVLALLALGGIASVAAFGRKGSRAEPMKAPATASVPVTVAVASPKPAGEAPKEKKPTEKAVEEEERPIEEVLADSGEDPGAVYYTSRIREAVREGNPAFGRVLLGQMKEQHPSSVLLEEAEAILLGAR